VVLDAERTCGEIGASSVGAVMAREVAFGARDTAGPPNPSAWSNAAQNSAARV
jgi:hypothetical protein